MLTIGLQICIHQLKPHSSGLTHNTGRLPRSLPSSHTQHTLPNSTSYHPPTFHPGTHLHGSFALIPLSPEKDRQTCSRWNGRLDSLESMCCWMVGVYRFV